MGDSRGSIAFFATYRPPVPLDIFSCPADPPPSSEQDEVLLTDGENYNQNGRPIPAGALKELLVFIAEKKPELLSSECGVATPEDVDKGRVSGLLFVSERDDGLETLYVALRFSDRKDVKVLSMAAIYGDDTFCGVRMEDSPCFAGGFTVGTRYVGYSLVYVSTKEPAGTRRTPWTAVYKTNLADGATERLTPPDQQDLSPAVSPSGKMVAVANFRWNQWTGEIEKLKTDIVVMNVDREAQGGLQRRILMLDEDDDVLPSDGDNNGGWPTWGSDKVIFFHRWADRKKGEDDVITNWGVFRHDISTKKTIPVTPEHLDAMTPAAISETKVAVATIRQKSELTDVSRVEAQYRHIEIFDVDDLARPVEITTKFRPLADHYNPFVLDGGSRVGYHRSRADKLLQSLQTGADNNGVPSSSVPRKFYKLQSPHAEVGLFRVSGVFPTISKDGSKLAFVDNEFKAVWLADSHGLRVVYERRSANSVFSTAWNQNPDRDTLYVCVGPSFNATQQLEIYAIRNASGPPDGRDVRRLTYRGFNNAFPSSSPDGSKLVFRSTCDRSGGQRKHKNLYVMEDVEDGEFGQGNVTRLTRGEWVDTHCSWSPREGSQWIVFSSSRDRPGDEPEKAVLDAGFFAVYLVKANDPAVVQVVQGQDSVIPKAVRVVHSSDTFAGHVNHPVFSPDMRSIVFASDLAGVSAEPISMPHFVHSVRPYGDIFSVDLRDTGDDITKNEDIQEFHRITHSRYEYSTPTWTMFATDDPHSQWNTVVYKTCSATFTPACPYAHPNGAESWHMTGHLTFPSKRCC